MSAAKSEVWEHFSKDSIDSSKVTCTHCKVVIQRGKDYSTSSMRKHLSRHKLDLPTSSVINGPPTKKTRTLFDYYTAKKKQTSLADILSKLVSVDRLSIQQICESDFIRSAISAKGFTLPKSPNTIRRVILDHCDNIKSSVRASIEEKFQNGERFSATLDEWTSSQNRRYININLHDHGGLHYNLGLIRVTGSATAQVIDVLVRERLCDFGIHADQLVGITSDGASVMIAYGRLTECEHVVCYAHGLHLAVQDVFYASTTTSENDLSQNTDFESDGECNSSDENSEYDDSTMIEFGGSDLRQLIRKVRTVVIRFRRSPLKNDKLQEYIKCQHGKSYVLIRDNKTRWNSMVNMIERFLLVHDSIQKAMIDFPDVRVDFSTDELLKLKDIIDSLAPVKLAVEKLSARSTNLLKADAIFTFLINSLSQRKTPYCSLMKAAVEKRYTERRPSKLLDAFLYLHNPDLVKFSSSALFKHGTKKQVQETVARIFQRLNLENDSQNSDAKVVTQIEVDQPISMEEALNRELEAFSDGPSDTRDFAANVATKTNLNVEFKLLETSKVRGNSLSLLYKQLSTIQCTSCEAERVFSAAAQFATKQRSNMSDKLLDALAFMRGYFMHSNIDKQ